MSRLKSPSTSPFATTRFARIDVASDQQVKCAETFSKQSPVAFTFDVPAVKANLAAGHGGSQRFRDDVTTQLFVKNYGLKPAAVKVTTTSTIATPR
jgi:hypothetical protein